MTRLLSGADLAYRPPRPTRSALSPTSSGRTRPSRSDGYPESRHSGLNRSTGSSLRPKRPVSSRTNEQNMSDLGYEKKASDGRRGLGFAYVAPSAGTPEAPDLGATLNPVGGSRVASGERVVSRDTGGAPEECEWMTRRFATSWPCATRTCCVSRSFWPATGRWDAPHWSTAPDWSPSHSTNPNPGPHLRRGRPPTRTLPADTRTRRPRPTTGPHHKHLVNLRHGPGDYSLDS